MKDSTGNRPFVAALTGSIGSGKTTAASMLEELGATIIDADVLAREVVSPGSAVLGALVSSLGPSVLQKDGALNRQKLADIIFSDQILRKTAEAIIHPAVHLLFEQKLKALSEAGRKQIVIYVVPLLFEARLQLEQFDAIVVVSAPEETLLRRVLERGGTREDAARRLEAQLPGDHKERLAHIVIRNNGSLGELRSAVESAWKQLSRMARRK